MKAVRKIYRNFSLTMAFLILVSSSNLAVNLHFCQGKLAGLSFLGVTKTCSSSSRTPCSSMKKETQAEGELAKDDKNCCENELLYLYSDQNLFNTINDFAIPVELQQFFTFFIIAFYKKNTVRKPEFNIQNYRPPIVFKDISVLYQSFLL